jgi:hypothetical protein
VDENASKNFSAEMEDSCRLQSENEEFRGQFFKAKLAPTHKVGAYASK